MVGQTSLQPWLSDLLSAYEPVLTELFWFAVGFGVVYLVGNLVLVQVVTRVVRTRNRNNPTIASATKTYLRVLVVGFAILTGVIAAGYGRLLSQSAVVIAAITFVFGVAGQQVFGSLISGVFLVADPDFNVGDWIEWPDGQGTVEAVHFRVTRVRTPNNGTVSVPNTQLTSNALTRPFGRDTYRVTETVYVAYNEDTERALLELRQVAGNHDAVVDEPEPRAQIQHLGENAITLEAQFWVDDPTNQDIVSLRSGFRRRVKQHFDEEGITLAPPSAQSVEGELTVTEQSSEAHSSDG
jgi:small-conductance mechanosensitive channel